MQIPDEIRETIGDALNFKRTNLVFRYNQLVSAPAQIAHIDAALAWLRVASSYPVAMDAPDGLGWWAFEGSEWESELVACPSGDEGARKIWDEDRQDYTRKYYKYVDAKSMPFQTIVEVKWVLPGFAISNRQHSGPHRGQPVLGFLSPKYRWNNALYGIDTWAGKWWRVTLPWNGAPVASAQEDNDHG